MLGNIYQHTIFSPRTYCVLEIVYDSRTAYRLNLYEVTRFKKTQFKVKSLLENTALEDLKKAISAQHIAVLIRGNVLLQDHIKLEDDTKNPEHFNLDQNFSFGQIDDYVISSYFTPYTCYITSVRKDIVQHWVTALNKEKLDVFSVSLGLNALVNYFKGIKLKPGIYSWENIALNWDGEYIEEYLGEEDPQALMQAINEEEDQSIESLGLPALSVIVSHYFKLPTPNLTLEDSGIHLNIQEEGFYISNFIKKIAFVVLPVLFLGLLINFFAFSDYSKEANQLNETLSTNEFKWKIYEDLKQKFENNKRVLTRSSKLGSMSYYADQIAHLRPYQVTFSKVDVYPLTEKGMEYSIDEHTLFIEGYSAKHSQYQAWIKLLDKTEWIETLKTISYKRNAETGLTKFTLKIDIHHE